MPLIFKVALILKAVLKDNRLKTTCCLRCVLKAREAGSKDAQYVVCLGALPVLYVDLLLFKIKTTTRWP